MSLSKLLKEIETNRPNAEMEVTQEPSTTYGGRVGLKRAATETIKRLKLDYRNELMLGTVFIVVTGPARDAFTELASSDEFGCFSTDPDEFFKDLASRVTPSLFGREGARQLFNIAGNILEDKMMELDVGSYQGISFSEKYNTGVKNVEDFIPVIKRAINDQVGPEIVGINAIHAILDRAIAKNHSAPVTPVILSTSDQKYALELYKNLPELVAKGTLSPAMHAAKKKLKSFLVFAGGKSSKVPGAEDAVFIKTVNEGSVGEALSAIRSRIL